tara:strand:+ start:339 stop:590 length:252 start_codon:yes stop_codon:yes gene_type:complete
MIFDLIALWTGRILLISLAWLIIYGIWYGTFTYLYRYSPAFRFAIFSYIKQTGGKVSNLKTLKLYNGKTYQFSELVDKTHKED